MNEVDNFKYMVDYEQRQGSFIKIPSNINSSQNLLYKSLKKKLNRRNTILDHTKIVEKKMNIIVVKNKGNNFVLKIQPEDRLIERTKLDINWLSDYLRIEFPFYYIPPVNCKDMKEKFIQNFFERILDKCYIINSKVLEIFVDDEKFKKLKNKNMEYLNDFMLNKINTMFSIGSQKDKILENEMFYDGFFGNLFPDYHEKRVDPTYFINLFKNLSNHLLKDSTIFSRLRKLAVTLAENLKITGEIIYKISSLLNTSLNHSKKYFSSNTKEFEIIQKKLKIGFDEWGSQIFSQTNFVKDNLESFFQFRKYESRKMSSLLKLRNISSKEAIDRINEIKKKKKKLFDSKDISKWGFDEKEKDNIGDFYELMSDYDKAKEIILPDESYLSKQINSQSLFINKHVLFEFSNYYKNSNYYLEENFKVFCGKLRDSYAKEDLLWNLFESDNMELLNLDKEVPNQFK